jgi:hypothetical protein
MMRMAEPQQADVLVEREIDRIANTPCPLAEREQRIAKLEEEIDRPSAPRRPLSSLRMRHVRLDARHGPCWVLRL